MLTVDSTKRDVAVFINSNLNKLRAQMGKAKAEWSKIVRNAKGQIPSMLYEYEVNGVKCYHYRRRTGKLFNYVHMIAIPFAKDKYQYIEYDSDALNMWKYTHHFFERYKERLGLKYSTKQVVKHYLNHTNPMICIYRKNNQIVFAIQNGLILGVDDEKLAMQVGCTFVDYNLLKVSQKAAFNKAQEISEKMVKQYEEMNKSGIPYDVCLSVLEEKYKDVRKVAEEIYSMYFEIGDLRERKH